MNGRLTRAGLSTLVATLLLAACGQGSASTPSSSTPSSSATGSASPTPSPSEASPSAQPRPAAPAGSRWVTATESGVEFVVPSTWKTIDFASLLGSADTTKINAVAKSLHLTTSQLTQAAQTIDLYVIDTAKASFSSNINTILMPLTELPTAADVAPSLSSMGMTVTSSTTITTGAGPALLMAYQGSISGKTYHGVAIIVQGDNGVVDITVTADTAGKVQSVSKALITSLRPHSA